MSFFLAGEAQAQINPAGPTTSWTPVLYPAGNPTTPDPFTDQQTGSKEADIVGTTSRPSLYTWFYDAGTPSLTDGDIAFRFRLAQEDNPPGFSGAAFVGLDVNLDGRLDIFLGVDNSGSKSDIGIWKAGTGLNVSPSTTTIVSPPAQKYSQTTNNYSFTAVTAVNDPGQTNFDIDGGGKTDRFLSFVVPFADVISVLGTMSITNFSIANFNQNSPLTYVAATATQDNSLNQDLNGVNGGVNSTTSWKDLGAITRVYSAGGVEVVPEPTTGLMVLAGAGLLLLGRRFRRS